MEYMNGEFGDEDVESRLEAFHMKDCHNMTHYDNTVNYLTDIAQ